MQKEICELTKEELLNPEFIPSIFKEYSDKEERDAILSEIIEVSTKHDVFTKVKNQIDIYNKKVNTNINVQAFLILNSKGEPEPTTGNYVNIFNKDTYLQKLFCYDEFDRKIKCYDKDGVLRAWSDDDESALKVYIEENYNIYHHQKFNDAFRAVAVNRKIHPLKDIIEEEEWDGVPRVDGFLKDIMGCEDDDYTREVSRMIFYGGINRLYNPGCKFDYMPILIGKQGCVDCNTEYFNGEKWVSISEYNTTDSVLQYNKDGSVELVKPLRYIKQESNKLYHFKTFYGLDQCLSPEHNVVYINTNGKLCTIPMEELKNRHEITPFSGRFITGFRYSGEGIDLSCDMIRLYVAIFADGAFYNNVKPTAKSFNRVRFHLKKERKKERLKYLLNTLNISYREYKSANKGYTDYYFDVPFREKHYPAGWYKCNKEQLETIADEVVYWDGCYVRKNAYSTTNKNDADFIQFVYSSLGYYASIGVKNRVGKYYYTYKKLYKRKSIEYVVHFSKEYLKSLNTSKNNRTKIEEVTPADGFEYCFTVPSGMLVLRRNNCIFITGNCGKSTIIKWLALEDKYYTDITNIEGKEGIEILDSSWVCEMGELLAMVRTKEVEMLKAYISRTSDRYRVPYGRYANDIPRHCIFIGSTNDMTFLMDKTGNRRYLPIVCNSNGRDIYKQRWIIKKYILQCWREALYLMRHNKTYLCISAEYDNIVLDHQRSAVMEDPRIGLILSYLNDKKSGDKVSGIELFTKCLNGLKKNYNTSEGKEISRIMDMLEGWYRCDRFYDKDFGQQRGWIKLDKKHEQTKRITIFDDEEYQDDNDLE